eukprot:gene16739-20473_t
MTPLMKSLTIVAAASLCLGARAAFADSELDRLKGSYQAAMERAMAPLQTAYERELVKLMERHTKAGNLTAALEVRTEIEQVTGKPMVDPAAKPASTPVGKPKELEDYLVNRTWRTPTGTNFNFADKGKGSRQFGNDKTDFKWKKKGKNLVEVT